MGSLFLAGFGGLDFPTASNDQLDSLSLILDAQGGSLPFDGIPLGVFPDSKISNYGEDWMSENVFSILGALPKVSSFLPIHSNLNFMTKPLGTPPTGPFRNRTKSKFPQNSSSIFDPDEKILTEKESGFASVVDTLNIFVNASLLQSNPSAYFPVTFLPATEPSSNTYFTNIHFSVFPLPLPRPLDSKNVEEFSSGEEELKPAAQTSGQSHKQERDNNNGSASNKDTHRVVANVTSDEDYAVNIRRELTMFDVLKLFMSGSASKDDRNETVIALNITSMDEELEEQAGTPASTAATAAAVATATTFETTTTLTAATTAATTTTLTAATTATTLTAELMTKLKLHTAVDESVGSAEETTRLPEAIDNAKEDILDAMNATTGVDSSQGTVTVSDESLLHVTQESLSSHAAIAGNDSKVVKDKVARGQVVGHVVNAMTVDDGTESASGLDVMDDKRSNKTQTKDTLTGSNIPKQLLPPAMYSTPHHSAQFQTTSEQPESDTSKEGVKN